MVSGWLEAGGYVLAIGVLGIAYATANFHGAHVVVFILYSLLVSAVALLAVAGLGPEPLRIMLAPQSWLVGLSNLAMEATFFLMLSTVPPADATLIARLSIPFALVLGMVLLGRRPAPLAWLGAAVVLAGVGLVVATFDLSRQGIGLLYGTGAALLITIRAFATELHPWNRAARTVAEKMRVTGLVVLVTALTGMALAAAAAALVSAGTLPRTELVAAPADLLHVPTILMAAFVGGAVFTAMNYFQFSSVVKIRTENFLAAGAFMPFATLLLQFPARDLGLIRVDPFDWRLLPAMLLTVAGVMILIRARK